MNDNEASLYKKCGAIIGDILYNHDLYSLITWKVKAKKFGLEKATEIPRFFRAQDFKDPDVPDRLSEFFDKAYEINKDEAIKLIIEIGNQTSSLLANEHRKASDLNIKNKIDSDARDLNLLINKIEDFAPKIQRVPYTSGTSKEFIEIKPTFQIRKVSVEGDFIFTLIPFKSPFNEHFEEIIKPTVEKIGLNCYKADDITKPSSGIVEKIWNLIYYSRIVIADLTELNTNVFYELGVADAFGKPLIMMWNQDQGDKPPFDIGHREILVYSTYTVGKLNKWRQDIEKSIRSLL